MNVTSKMNAAPLYYLPICQGEAILSWVTQELSTAWILFFPQCSYKLASEERITTTSKQTPQHRCSFGKVTRPFPWPMQVSLSPVLLLMFVTCPNFLPLRSMNDKPLSLSLLLRVCLCASFRTPSQASGSGCIYLCWALYTAPHSADGTELHLSLSTYALPSGQSALQGLSHISVVVTGVKTMQLIPVFQFLAQSIPEYVQLFKGWDWGWQVWLILL